MVALGITVIITILVIAQFYLKNSIMKSLAMVFCGLFGFIVAMNFAEPASNFLIFKGWIMNWAPAIVFAILFVLAMAIPFSLAGLLTGDAIDFGKVPKGIINVLCGGIFGLIVSGVFIIFLGLLSLPNAMPYPRYDIEAFNPKQSKAAIIPVDSMLTGMFSYISSGSMSRGNEFDFINADYLDKIYLNNRMHRGEIAPCVGKDAIKVRGEDVEFDENNSRLLITLNLETAKIADGGVRSPEGSLSFFPAQARLVYRDNGQTKLLYPVSLRTKTRAMNEKDMDYAKAITLTGDDVTGGFGKVQIAYEVSRFPEGAILQFKNNGYAAIPKPRPQE